MNQNLIDLSNPACSPPSNLITLLGLQDRIKVKINRTPGKKEDQVLIMRPVIFKGGPKVIDPSENGSVHQ